MNREDLIRMALEAGMQANVSKDAVNALGNSVPVQWLDRFAELVAEAERRKHQADIETWKAEAATAEKWRAMAFAKDPMQPGKAVQEIQREAMELEREACAKVCEEMAEHYADYKDTALLNGDIELSNAASGEPRAAITLARLIRERGSQ